MTRKRQIDMMSAFVLCALVAGLTWFLLDKQRELRFRDLAQIETDFRLRALARDVKVRVNAIRHIAALWRKSDAGSDEFTAETQDYIDQFPGIRSVRFIDETLVVKFVTPADQPPDTGVPLTALGARQLRASELARDSGEITLSGAVDLYDGSGRGFVAYIPIHRGEDFRGLVSVAFNAEEWQRELLLLDDNPHFGNDFSIRIEFDGSLLYADADFATMSSLQVVSETDQLWGHALRMQSHPTPSFVKANRDITPEIAALLLGILLFAGYVQFTLLHRGNQAEARADAGNARLRQVNEALALEVDDRRRAEAAARQSQAATSRFLTTMSHEIRTPLNAIMGMFQLIEAADIPERHRKQAAAGYASSQRLFRGLTNVLEVSRLDAGALTIVEDHVELEPLIANWHATLEGSVIRSGKPLDMHLELGDALPQTVHIDAGRVTQIVTNLVDNAVRFTATGSITLAVHMTGRSGNSLEIEVRDTGEGIPEERRHTVFQRFYQLDNGLARQHQGSGLGLSICRDIARLMGANLTHSDRKPLDVGSGSTFTLRLHNVHPRRDVLSE